MHELDTAKPMSIDDPPERREARYRTLHEHLALMLEEEPDWVAAMATVACELHHSFAYFDWTGFYRVVAEETLAVGPYQGSHGCLRIEFSRGVCGAAARTRTIQRVPDVEEFPGHIACSSSTRSEIVVPILTPDDELLGVLDVDSDTPDAFDEIDESELAAIAEWLGTRYRIRDHAAPPIAPRSL